MFCPITETAAEGWSVLITRKRTFTAKPVALTAKAQLSGWGLETVTLFPLGYSIVYSIARRIEKRNRF